MYCAPQRPPSHHLNSTPILLYQIQQALRRLLLTIHNELQDVLKHLSSLAVPCAGKRRIRFFASDDALQRIDYITQPQCLVARISVRVALR